MAKQVRLHAGSYVLCKYHGNNGDLVVGQIQSVTRAGKVVCKNLLTHADSTKDLSIFLDRNALVKKKDADAVLDIYARSYKTNIARGLTPISSACDARKLARRDAVIRAHKYERVHPTRKKPDGAVPVVAAETPTVPAHYIDTIKLSEGVMTMARGLTDRETIKLVDVLLTKLLSKYIQL